MREILADTGAHGEDFIYSSFDAGNALDIPEFVEDISGAGFYRFKR